MGIQLLWQLVFKLPDTLANGSTDTMSFGTEALIGNESAYTKVPGDLNSPPSPFLGFLAGGLLLFIVVSLFFPL